MLLGKVDEKSARVFNLFIGSMQVMTPFYLIFTSTGDSWMILNASGIFLFGLTYLYVRNFESKNFNSSGLGWYSLWVAILALGYSYINFIKLQDIKFGIIWLMWSFLWTLFYLLLAQKRTLLSLLGGARLFKHGLQQLFPLSSSQ